VSEGGASPAGTSNVPSEGASADDLRQYRVALAIAARRFKRYPLLARERGWAGRVEVAVNLSAWQPNPRLSLVQSSGHAALDEQALSMIEQASATTTLPESLRGRISGYCYRLNSLWRMIANPVRSLAGLQCFFVEHEATCLAIGEIGLQA
jgi:TonB family protein